uniref:Uncharacterized protein n=1 Tax=Musa acuminata subsp. malaccensis TaxID=214687 RepID=A0A804JBM9_MUSAM
MPNYSQGNIVHFWLPYHYLLSLSALVCSLVYLPYQEIEAAESTLTTFKPYEITEEMRQEMDYNADRAWYDRDEHNTMFDGDSSSLFGGDDASYKKKEASLAKKLTRKDGTLMTLAQSKKLSQLTADNAQWEDRQLLRSGAVRGTEVQIDFEDEDERKVILLVHGMLKLDLIVLQYYSVMSLSLPLMLCSSEYLGVLFLYNTYARSKLPFCLRSLLGSVVNTSSFLRDPEGPSLIDKIKDLNNRNCPALDLSDIPSSMINIHAS